MKLYALESEKYKIYNGKIYIRIKVKCTTDNIIDPKVSVCFFSETDNRILPMRIVELENNITVAEGMFDVAYIYYNNKIDKTANFKFLFFNGNDKYAIIKPKKAVVVNINKKNKLKEFICSKTREKKKIIVSLIMRCLFFPYKCLNVKSNQVAFLSNRSDKLDGNLKAVYDKIKDMQNIKTIVMCKKGGIKSNFLNLFRFFKIYATSKIVFVDDYYHFITYLNKKKDVILIQLWHACGAFKTFGFSRLITDANLSQNSLNHRQYDYVAVSSKEVVPYYAEGFGVSTDKIVPLGSPRCDIIVNAEHRDKFLKSFYDNYPQLKNKKIMLFAPTFRGSRRDNSYYPIERFEIDEILDQLSDEWVIIVKMHPYLNERPMYSDKYKNRVFDFTLDYNINDLLLLTDVLITDYSSVIFEASMLNVPMLFFVFDLYDYIKNRGFYFGFSSFIPGKIVNCTDEIISAVKNNDLNSHLIEPFKERFFGNTVGHATDNVVEFIKEILNNE